MADQAATVRPMSHGALLPAARQRQRRIDELHLRLDRAEAEGESRTSIREMIAELHALQQAEADAIASWAAENVFRPLANARAAQIETKAFLDDFDADSSGGNSSSGSGGGETPQAKGI